MKQYQIALILFFGTIFNACAQQNNQDINNKTNMKFTINKTEQEWKENLSDEQYYILREKGTERPNTGKFLLHKENGVYTCAGCGNELFSSDMKFDSHCGWPSFDKEIAGGKIVQVEDNSLGMRRVEIMCAKCGGHLGHIFNDGPTETGMRYCVNSGSLGFEPVVEKRTEITLSTGIDTVTLGGGCFWCIEAVYQQLNGITKVSSGYSGGTDADADYKAVCTGNTAHAEVVQIEYDRSKIGLAEILKVFFTVHDPTTLNRQGADRGTQYRSVVFYRNEEQKNITTTIINQLNQEKVYDNPIVTEVSSFDRFYMGEAYHQNYYQQNQSQPYCKMVIQPKLEKFEKVFKAYMKK